MVLLLLNGVFYVSGFTHLLYTLGHIVYIRVNIEVLSDIFLGGGKLKESVSFILTVY